MLQVHDCIQTHKLKSLVGNYPLRDGHPLVYASLLNHANYFLDQPTRLPSYTEEVNRPVRQAWFITHQVDLPNTPLQDSHHIGQTRPTTTSKSPDPLLAYTLPCLCWQYDGNKV